MQLNPAEISELIKSRIEGLGASTDIRNQGTVVSVTDGICRVHGLSDAMAGEMLEFPAGPDGQPTTPASLNDWFKAEARQTASGTVSRGYVYGGVNWLAVAAYSKLAAARFGTPAWKSATQASGRRPSRLPLPHSKRTPTSSACRS